jgi:hypothetical protein
MSNEPQSSEKMPSPSDAPPAPADFDADAALVLTALGRMETAIRGERLTFARLRAALGETATAIAQAKRAIKPEAGAAGKPLDVALLLEELGHCVDAMIEMAHERPGREAGDDRVPTVSGVVSRLGRGLDTGADSPRDVSASAAPTVSMLQAMVEALHVSEPAAPEPAAPPLDLDTDVIFATQPEPPPEPAAAVEPAPAAHASAPLAEPADKSDAAAYNSDLDAFLFGSDLDPRPAQPPRPAAPNGGLPQVDLVVAAPAPAPAQKQPPQASANPAPERRAVSPDPLAPLNAMSDEEKLALFS